MIAVSMIMAGAAQATAGGLVMLSSATYRGVSGDDMANCLATDSSGNIFVAGDRYDGATGDFCIVKYDRNLHYLAGKTYDFGGDDHATGIAVDRWGNVFVTGVRYASGADFCTVKYDNNLQFVSSATFNMGDDDYARDVAVDGDGDVFVAGYCYAGSVDCLVVKYTNGLQFISSATYDNGGDDYAYGIAADAQNNIFIAGQRKNGSGFEYLVIKYDDNLHPLACASSSANYYSAYNRCGAHFNGIAVDRSGGVIAAGWKGVNPANMSEYVAYGYAAKYDASLHLISSTTYDCGGKGNFTGVTMDRAGNAVVSGNRSDGSAGGYLTVVYDDSFRFVSSAADAGGTNGVCTAAAIGADNDILVAGYMKTSPQNYVTVKYRGAPVIASVTPLSGPLAGGTTVTITGTGFVNGTAAAVGGITATAVVCVSPTCLTAVTPPGVSTGTIDVTVRNPDGLGMTLPNGYAYVQNRSTSVPGNVDPATGGTVAIDPESGEITVEVPGGAFGNEVTIRIATITIPSSAMSTVRTTNLGVEITCSDGAQPAKAVTVTLYYRDSDVAGFDETALVLARYDNGAWVPVPTVVYPEENRLVGTVEHLSVFAVIQLVTAGRSGPVRAYPNPYNPERGVFTFTNLDDNAEIRIYGIGGELVRTLTGSVAGGSAAWNGRNDGGGTVASGVYLAFIKSPQGKKTVKIAVER